MDEHRSVATSPGLGSPEILSSSTETKTKGTPGLNPGSAQIGTIFWKHVASYNVRSSHQGGPNDLLALITSHRTESGDDIPQTWAGLFDRSV